MKATLILILLLVSLTSIAQNVLSIYDNKNAEVVQIPAKSRVKYQVKGSRVGVYSRILDYCTESQVIFFQTGPIALESILKIKYLDMPTKKFYLRGWPILLLELLIDSVTKKTFSSKNYRYQVVNFDPDNYVPILEKEYIIRHQVLEKFGGCSFEVK